MKFEAPQCLSTKNKADANILDIQSIWLAYLYTRTFPTGYIISRYSVGS